jgi:N-acetylmuramoyl-L-alanine amidase
MGGTVVWNGATGEVTVDAAKTEVKLKVGSTKAYINGAEMSLDVPARIIDSRTMIPVRFVSEAVGCKVSWDEKNRIVGIASPVSEEDLTAIKSIELSHEGDKVVVNADKEITDYTSFKMANPSRLVFDINNAKLNIEDGTIETEGNPFFKSIRYSQYTRDSVRIVADLMNASSGSVSRSDSLRTAYMTFEVNDPTDLPSVAAGASQKLVVIDPGHGGSDTGSRGFENDAPVMNEKDINLDIALRLQKMLEAAGARIYMIRTEDVTIPLYDRQDTANSLGASLYVAIHNNSYTNTNINGTEVHYHGKNDPPMDGISGMALAENLQSTLVANLGLFDRGIKESPELAVLRRTVMPAVIIEGAYISNPGDLNYMKTDDFREKYAMSAAKCIIEALNSSVANREDDAPQGEPFF